MATARSARWKDLERTAARKLGGRRIIRQDFFESSPDVKVDDFDLIVECKTRKSFSFHRHIEQARKYCTGGEAPLLVTKAENQIGEFATVPLDWLAALLRELREYRGASR